MNKPLMLALLTLTPLLHGCAGIVVAGAATTAPTSSPSRRIPATARTGPRCHGRIRVQLGSGAATRAWLTALATPGSRVLSPFAVSVRPSESTMRTPSPYTSW